MPKVLVVAAQDTTIAQFLSPHVLHLKHMGLQVEVAYRSTTVEAGRYIQELGVRTHEVPFARTPLESANLVALGHLRGILRAGQYDVVHVHMPVSAWIGRLAARVFSPRSIVVYTAHGFRFHDQGAWLANLLYVELERIAGRWTDYLEVINREDAESARKLRIVPVNRIWHVPGVGVDTDSLSPERLSSVQVQAIRGALGLRSSDILITVVAAFLPRKRHLDALAALAKLEDARVHLVLAGLGPTMERVRAYSQRLGLAHRVHFLGYRTDVAALMGASAAVLLPSEFEGLPCCVMESLALGTPVIGTDIRGTRELLDDGCGIMVPVGDVDALARSLGWVIAHPREAVAMAHRGREKMETRYSLRHALAATEALYREMLRLT